MACLDASTAATATTTRRQSRWYSVASCRFVLGRRKFRQNVQKQAYKHKWTVTQQKQKKIKKKEREQGRKPKLVCLWDDKPLMFGDGCVLGSDCLKWRLPFPIQLTNQSEFFLGARRSLRNDTIICCQCCNSITQQIFLLTRCREWSNCTIATPSYTVYYIVVMIFGWIRLESFRNQQQTHKPQSQSTNLPKFAFVSGQDKSKSTYIQQQQQYYT